MSNGTSTETAPEAPQPEKIARPRKPRAGVLLFESDEFDGFTTQDLINGLHGVCAALDTLMVDYPRDTETATELSIASKILSSILRRRVASPNEVRL
jgi:hypothetical protein